MKFIYSTNQLPIYNFAKLGGVLAEDNTVELTDDAYKRFLFETKLDSHTLTLYKEPGLWKNWSRAPHE